MSFIRENEKRQEQIEEEQNNTTSGGKGTRTTKISGETLKTRLKNGQIPNQ